MAANTKTRADFGLAHVQMEISIDAPPQRVWQALTEETTHWWHKDFYTGPPPRSFHIEARLGGRVYEDWGDGAGFLWYVVVGVDPPRSLKLIGDMFPGFGGPARSMLQLSLEGQGERTILRVDDCITGRIDDDMLSGTHEGWTTLLGSAFKSYVEQAGALE